MSPITINRDYDKPRIERGVDGSVARIRPVRIVREATVTDSAFQGIVNDTGSAGRGALDDLYAPILSDGAGVVREGDLFYNVRDYGAVGNGIADDGPAIQAAIDAAFLTGGLVYFPAGKYRVTSTLALDLRGVTGAPDSNARRVTLRGAGKGNTVLLAATDNMTILHIQGDNPLTSASHAYTTITDLAFGGSTPTARTADGLRLQNLAYLTVADCSFHNLETCLVLDGVLSCSFRDLAFNESTRGVVANSDAVGCHSNLWTGCEFRALTSLAYEALTSVTGTTFVNCRFEGCGTMGVSTGIIRQVTTGTAGEHSLALFGCYIENNRGTCDIYLEETSTRLATLTAVACTFNRISGTNYVTNVIRTVGDIDVNLMGNTFTSYNDYVPSSTRPYLSLSTTTRLRDSGNRWEDAVEAPILGQSLPYAGFVAGDAGDLVAATSVLPNGWSVSKSATGVFTVVHNLGHLDYAVNATAASSVGRRVQRVIPGTNSFQVLVTNLTDAGDDTDFGFSLQVLKPRR